MKNFQSLKAKLEVALPPVLEEFHLKIYEINNFSEFGDDILQILVEDQSDLKKRLDIDTLLKVNEAVSALMDQYETEIPGAYLLEVASAGIERPIKTAAELEQAVGDYVYVELTHPIKQTLDFNGTVKSYDPESQQFTFSYFLKGQPKKLSVAFEQIKFVRYAIKF
jgi:ribosome maturation factor RimP